MKAAKDGYEHGKGKSLILIDTEWFLVSGFWNLESGIWNLEPHYSSLSRRRGQGSRAKAKV